MIEIIGTSHISPESVSTVKQRIEEMEDGVVAVELDPKRLQFLKEGEQKRQKRILNPFLALMRYLQQKLSKKTGVTPGTELLSAVEAADEKELPIALIDQDISITLKRLRGSVPWLEKAKAGLYMLGALILPFGRMIDLEKVPDDDFIQEMLEELESSFPNMYRVLIQERNAVMARKLLYLDDEFENVVAFVGAGHVEGIEKIIEENSY